MYAANANVMRLIIKVNMLQILYFNWPVHDFNVNYVDSRRFLLFGVILITILVALRLYFHIFAKTKHFSYFNALFLVT